MFYLLLHKISGVLEFFKFYFLSNPHQCFSWETSSIPVLIRHPISQSKTPIWQSSKFQKARNRVWTWLKTYSCYRIGWVVTVTSPFCRQWWWCSKYTTSLAGLVTKLAKIGGGVGGEGSEEPDRSRLRSNTVGKYCSVQRWVNTDCPGAKRTGLIQKLHRKKQRRESILVYCCS